MNVGDYYQELNERALEGFQRFNRTTRVEVKSVPFSAGGLEINVVRGRVLEKAATARIRLKTVNPKTGEDTRFDVFQIKVYPSNPMIPILLVNIEHRSAREERFGGFLDVAPVACSEDEVSMLQGAIKDVVKKWGVAYEPLRKRLVGMYKMDRWEKALNAAAGIRLDLYSEHTGLVREAADTWLERYFTIVTQREGDSDTEEQTKQMNVVRARIMEFYILKDISFSIIQKLGVTLEDMALIHFAPTIRF